MIFLFIALLLAAAYLLAIAGRTGHPGLAELKKWAYAHRGLHGDGVPENSMPAFRLALEQGYGIELDLHLTTDGRLAVIHDASLRRTAGADVLVEDLTFEALGQYPLEGTQETVPEFSQILELFAGKAPMIVELKAERGNHARLCAAACELLDRYDGPYCIESFDPRCLLWLKKNRPQIIRGQLSENFFRDDVRLNPVLKFVLTHLLTGFLTRPDFIAHKFSDRKGLSPVLSQKLWGVQSVSWTLRTPEEYRAALAENRMAIFEFFRP